MLLTPRAHLRLGHAGGRVFRLALPLRRGIRDILRDTRVSGPAVVNDVQFEHTGGERKILDGFHIAGAARPHMRVLPQHEGAHTEFADQLAEEETEGFRGERERIPHEQHVVHTQFVHDAQPLVDAHEPLGIGNIRRRLLPLMGFCVLMDDTRPRVEQDDHREGVVALGQFNGSSDHRTVSLMHAVEGSDRDDGFTVDAQGRPVDQPVDVGNQIGDVHAVPLVVVPKLLDVLDFLVSWFLGLPRPL